MIRSITLQCAAVFLLTVAALAQEPGDQAIPPELREPTETIAAALDGVAPEGWEAVGAIERYTPLNLFDKINGRSELFMSYGVTGMTFVGLAPADGDPDRFIDVFLYDMVEPINAFGVYSVEKWPDNPKVDVGRAGNRSETDLMFWHGPYYVTLSASDANETTKAAQRDIAATLTGRLNDPGGALWFERLLPRENLRPDTVQYFRVDALGYDFMTDTVTAEYELNGGEATVFVSRQPDAQTARTVAERFTEAMRKYGDNPGEMPLEQAQANLADMGGGFYDAVFPTGRYVAGVTATESRPNVEAGLRLLESTLSKHR